MIKRNIITAILALLTLCGTAGASETKEITGWRHFVWGAEVGGAIDLTSNDMSTANLSAYLGYRNSWLDIIGIGAEVDMMVSNGVRAFPVYALMRTSFSSKPQLLFFDLRAGVAFNNINNAGEQNRLYLSPSLGINLAKGKDFQSYVSVGYVYNGLKSLTVDDEFHHLNGLHMGCLRLGISF